MTILRCTHIFLILLYPYLASLTEMATNQDKPKQVKASSPKALAKGQWTPNPLDKGKNLLTQIFPSLAHHPMSIFPSCHESPPKQKPFA